MANTNPECLVFLNDNPCDIWRPRWFCCEGTKTRVRFLIPGTRPIRQRRCILPNYREVGLQEYISIQHDDKWVRITPYVRIVVHATDERFSSYFQTLASNFPLFELHRDNLSSFQDNVQWSVKILYTLLYFAVYPVPDKPYSRNRLWIFLTAVCP